MNSVIKKERLIGISSILIASVGSLAGSEFTLPSNQTVQREHAWEIPSVAYDVATPMHYLQPGKLLRGSGDVNLHFRRDDLWREDLVEGTEDEGSRNHLGINMRFHTWKAQTEITVGIVDADAYGGSDLTDATLLLVFPLYQERYRAASLAFGIGYSAGDGEAIDLNYGESEKLVVQYRMTEQIAMHVIHINLGASMYRDGENEMDFERVTKDGDTIAAGSFTNDYIGLDVGLGWSWRYSKYMRSGIEVSGKWNDWDGGNGQELKDTQVISSLFTEVNFNAATALRIGLGIEPDRDDADSMKDSTVFDISLFSRF